MAGPTPPSPPSVPEVQARLEHLARLLRTPGLGSHASRQALTELVDELGRALAAGKVPPDEAAHLADSTAHLVEALRHEHEAGALSVARDRLEGALLGVEARAPFAAGLARRVMEALAGIGI
jgi:hypothetical protein